jgi:hypothetical protein
VSSGKTKLLLSAFILFLFAQFAVALYWTKPFPVLIGPAFGDSPPTTGTARFQDYRVVAVDSSGAATTLNVDEFFDGVPRWYVRHDLDFVLDETPAAFSGFHPRLALLRHAKLRSDAGGPAFAIYARRRLAALTGRTDWESLRIEHTLRTFNLDQEKYVGPASVDRAREFQLR